MAGSRVTVLSTDIFLENFTRCPNWDPNSDEAHSYTSEEEVEIVSFVPNGVTKVHLTYLSELLGEPIRV
jgi:hypothetical protein